MYLGPGARRVPRMGGADDTTANLLMALALIGSPDVCSPRFPGGGKFLVIVPRNGMGQ